MDFSFSREEEDFRQEIREFVKEYLPENRFAHRYEEEIDDEYFEFSLLITRELGKRKWLSLTWPRQYGGMEASILKQIVFKEEVGYWGIPGTAMGISGTNWVAPTLIHLGTEEQKQIYLPPIAAGERDGIWCTGYSEPDSGTDLASLQTQAKRVGDEYIINGQKVWTSSAHHARWCWLACRTTPNTDKKHQGLSIIIVDMQSEGVTVHPIKNLAGQHSFNEVFFNDVKVQISNLVGEENKGWYHLMKALSFERGLAIIYSGTLRRVIDELLVYTRENGLYDLPETQLKLSELAIDAEVMRMMAYESAWKLSNGMDITYQASRDKAYSDLLYEKFSRLGLEILGSYGMMDPLQKTSRWTRLKGLLEHLFWISPGVALAAGTTFTQRNIVGQFGLQLPRSY